jgi:hypothetical protein
VWMRKSELQYLEGNFVRTKGEVVLKSCWEWWMEQACVFSNSTSSMTDGGYKVARVQSIVDWTRSPIASGSDLVSQSGEDDSLVSRCVFSVTSPPRSDARRIFSHSLRNVTPTFPKSASRLSEPTRNTGTSSPSHPPSSAPTAPALRLAYSPIASQTGSRGTKGTRSSWTEEL